MPVEPRSRRYWSVAEVGTRNSRAPVPMTVGEEFAAWSVTLVDEQARILDSRGLLGEINLGAAAIDRGITAVPGSRARMRPRASTARGVGNRHRVDAVSRLRRSVRIVTAALAGGRQVGGLVPATGLVGAEQLDQLLHAERPAGTSSAARHRDVLILRSEVVEQAAGPQPMS